MLGVSFAAGSVPSSQIAARVTADVDLREVGSGTVSGTSLFRVSGFVPLALSGIADITKAAVGPLLAGADRPVLAGAAGGAAIAGHNWSPFLPRRRRPRLRTRARRPRSERVAWCTGDARWSGRGQSVQANRTRRLRRAVRAPARAHAHTRPRGAWVAACVVAPMWTKRVVGNAPPAEPTWRTYAHRLLFDRDPDEVAR